MGDSATDSRKLKASWQLKGIIAVLVFAPICIFTLRTLKQVQAPTRSIASVSEENPFNVEVATMDMSDLSSADLKKAFKYQLLRDVRATHFEDSLSLSLGLFMVRSDTGSKVFVCDRFSTIEFTVESGKNQRVIQSPCKVSDDQNHIEATSLIEKSEEAPGRIIAVKLLSDKKEDTLEVSSKDLRAVLGQEIPIEEIH